jgi:hypothetical protein
MKENENTSGNFLGLQSLLLKGRYASFVEHRSVKYSFYTPSTMRTKMSDRLWMKYTAVSSLEIY